MGKLTNRKSIGGHGYRVPILGPLWGVAVRNRDPVESYASKSKRPHCLGKGALPAMQNIASDLCAQKGVEICVHGIRPVGSTILVVENLCFDQAAVLLSLIDNARIYAQGDFDPCGPHLQTLAVRVAGSTVSASILESIVGDLAHGRNLIMSKALFDQVCETRSPRCLVRDVRVQLGTSGVTTVWLDPIH